MGFRIGWTVKMTGENGAKRDRDPIMMVCGVIFLIAAVIAIGCFVANEWFPSSEETASTGDKVTVEYIGTYYAPYGETYAVVFDTSYSNIANDNNIAKSNDFTKKDSYSPLTFTIGQGSMLSGFEDAVIGHKVGETFKVYLSEREGYVGPSETFTINSTGAVMSLVYITTTADFKNIYPDVTLSSEGFTSFQSKYGWSAEAAYVDSGNQVSIYYKPVVGDSYTVYSSGDTSVTLKVTSVGDGVIVYDLDVKNPVKVDGDKIQMIKLDLEETIYLTEVSGSQVTYKLGSEKVNEPLYFEIKLTKIE